jgi:hypothetical protein
MFLKAGQIRKLYDAETGKRIKTLQELQPGHNIVAAAYEPFKRGPYMLSDDVQPLHKQVDHGVILVVIGCG